MEIEKMKIPQALQKDGFGFEAESPDKNPLRAGLAE